MSETISINIVRKIIFDILIERSNTEMDAANELIEEEVAQTGISSNYANSIGWQSCGIRVLADDVIRGIIPIKEAIEILTPYEKKETKRKCQEWLKERNKKQIER